MTHTIPAPADSPPVDQTCDCPTSRTPGTHYDRIDTIHRPSCPVATIHSLGVRQQLTTIRYAPGTLDARLAAFGPVTR